MSREKHVLSWVKRLKDYVPHIYLHHPSRYGQSYLDIISNDDSIRRYYDESTNALIEVCREENLKMVIHAHYVETECANWRDLSLVSAVKERIFEFQRRAGEHLLWENSVAGIFSSENPQWVDEIVRPLGLNLCVDVSHIFLASRGNNDTLVDWLNLTKRYAKYYHVVDSRGEKHDGLALGQGRIDWVRVVPLLQNQEFVFEIDLRESDYADCQPMLDSHRYFLEMLSHS